MIAIAEAARRRLGSSLRDTVVGYHTLTVYFDPLRVDADWVEEQLAELSTGVSPEPDIARPLIEVPVCYGGECGPDLDDVAARPFWVLDACRLQHLLASRSSFLRVHMVSRQRLW